MNAILQIPTLKTLLVFSVAFGLTILGLFNIITMERYALAFAYFFLLSFGLIWYFKKIFLQLSSHTRWYVFLYTIGIALLIHIGACYLCLHYLGKPNDAFAYRGISFLELSGFFIWAKPMEVFWQQLMIIVLVKKLESQKLSLYQIMLVCMAAFGSIHIYQALRADAIIGTGFTIIALLFSVLFPYMILNIKNGYLYNYTIHLTTYSFVAILIRIV